MMKNKTIEELIEDERYLKLLSEKYPNTSSCSTEIINLEAIMNLPKGTEHFLSDLHGEITAFTHVLKNASGVIRRKVDDIFGMTMRQSDKNALLSLIYYPSEKLALVRNQEKVTVVRPAKRFAQDIIFSDDHGIDRDSFL